MGCFMAGFGSMLNRPFALSTVWWHSVLPCIQLLAGGPLIGAGVLWPFGRARLGAYLGFFVPIIAAIGYATSVIGWRAVLAEPSITPVVALIGFAVLMGIWSACCRIWKPRTKSPIQENLISD